MTTCPNAEQLSKYASELGWVTAIDPPVQREGTEMTAMRLTHRYVNPDTNEGWSIGLIVAWFLNPRTNRWGQAALDGSHTTAGGFAEHTDGREKTFTLASMRVVKEFIADPGALASWLEGDTE